MDRLNGVGSEIVRVAGSLVRSVADGVIGFVVGCIVYRYFDWHFLDSNASVAQSWLNGLRAGWNARGMFMF